MQRDCFWNQTLRTMLNCILFALAPLFSGKLGKLCGGVCQRAESGCNPETLETSSTEMLTGCMHDCITGATKLIKHKKRDGGMSSGTMYYDNLICYINLK